VDPEALYFGVKLNDQSLIPGPIDQVRLVAHSRPAAQKVGAVCTPFAPHDLPIWARAS
jgi:hypothetical protein